MAVSKSKKVIQISLRKETYNLMNNIVVGTNHKNKKQGIKQITKSDFIEIAIYTLVQQIAESTKNEKHKEEK